MEMSNDNLDDKMSNEELERQIDETLQHASNIGEQTAGRIAKRTAKEANTMVDALRLIAHDSQFQEDLKEVKGVGEKTLVNTASLSAQILKGSLIIVQDSLDALRVVEKDYLKARKAGKRAKEASKDATGMD